MEESLNDLRKCIKQYQQVDNTLRNLNKDVYNLREERKCLEIEMTDIIKQPEFSNFEKLKIEDDGSLIKIQRPQQWSKPWGLSKKDLQTHLNTYFTTNQTLNAETCMKFIIDEQSKKLVAHDYNFTRILPEDSS